MRPISAATSARRALAGLSAAVLGGALTVGLVGAGHAGRAEAATYASPGQVVSVEVNHATDTTGTLDLWQKVFGGGMVHAGGPYPVFVGSLGVGATNDNLSRTPAGVFSLTEAFGNQPSNGTRLPYFQAGPADWWDGEPYSANYNNHVHQAASPGPHSENLYAAGAVYAHAVVINYNRFPATPGMGSAFFLHVTNGQPTAGCVAMSSAGLDTVMRWINPAQQPVISIGVGSSAYQPVTTANAIADQHNPRGHLDAVTGYPLSGWVRVSGWAADPDNMRYPLTIQLLVDGRPATHFTVGTPRPDVARAIGAGPNQGFNQVVWVGAGPHRLCAYADNVGLGRANPNIGCISTIVH